MIHEKIYSKKRDSHLKNRSLNRHRTLQVVQYNLENMKFWFLSVFKNRKIRILINGGESPCINTVSQHYFPFSRFS